MLALFCNKLIDHSSVERLRAFFQVFFSFVSISAAVALFADTDYYIVLPFVFSCHLLMEVLLFNKVLKLASLVTVISLFGTCLVLPFILGYDMGAIEYLMLSICFFAILGVSSSEVFTGIYSFVIIAFILFTKIESDLNYIVSSILGAGLIQVIYWRLGVFVDENTLHNSKLHELNHDLSLLLKEAKLKHDKTTSELGALKRVRDDQSDKLREAKNMTQDIIASVAHEIRNPLHVIQQVFELRDDKGLIWSGAEESFNRIDRFVSDLLDMTKIDNNQLRIHSGTFDVVNLISELADHFEPKAKEKGLFFNFNYDHQIPSLLQGDKVRVYQVISNLLNNAIKFTDKGEVSFFVELSQLNQISSELRFSIMDTGVGIPTKHRKSVFEKFSRVGSLYKPGFGIGLSVVRELVDLMEGRIEISDTSMDIGVRFDVYLKLKHTSNSRNAQVIKSIARPLRGFKVLYAEDNVFNRLIIEQQLQPLEMDVTSAENGVEALECARSKSFDIILMDLQMPHMDGFLAATQIRKSSLNKKTPIIALTGNADLEVKNQLNTAGIDDVLTKPFTVDDLKAKITAVINGSPSTNAKTIKSMYPEG